MGGAPRWRRRSLLLAASLVAAMAAPLRGQTFLTQEEALALAFPGADAVERRTAYLSDAELARAAALAGEGVPVATGVVTHYVATREGEPLGVAYFDVHRVRTLPEVLMVVVGPDDRIRRVEVLRFQEPPDYLAPGAWLERFKGRRLDATMSVKGEVANITGATLTAGAVTAAVRRVLALHRVIGPFGAARR